MKIITHLLYKLVVSLKIRHPIFKQKLGTIGTTGSIYLLPRTPLGKGCFSSSIYVFFVIQLPCYAAPL